jgi:hypothetical protein
VVCAAAAAPDEVSAAGSRPLPLRVDGPSHAGRYERIEFQVQLEGVFHNPDNPDEVALDLEVTSPSGRRLTVPGFHYQPFEWRLAPRGGRPAEWFYPTGQPNWRVRFAPEEIGLYSATAVGRTRLGQRTSAPVTFQCVPSARRGPVRVSPRDPRFFEFSDGTPFFPLGHNVAFIGSGQYLDTERAAGVFRKMATNGANFARVWACSEDWAMAIEARKSAWGRSWNWNPPLVPMPGNEGYHADQSCLRLGGTNAGRLAISPSHPVALRPDTEYQITGQALTEPETSLVIELNRTPQGEPIRSEKRGQWVTFKRSFRTAANQHWLGEGALRVTGERRVWVHSLSLREAGGGPELLWEADLQRAPRGFYNPLDCAMLDRLLESADQHGIHLQLCLFTRDHYRFDLANPRSPAYAAAISSAQKLLRYAVARWGWSDRVFAWEYFNEMDPGAPTERFHRELGEYLLQTDPYRHLRTTSGWGPAPKHWEHPQLDVADLHWYLRPNSTPAWQDEVAAVLDRAALVRRHAPRKPAVLGEFGLADEKWGRSPYMTQDKDGVHFHNALWASAFSGLAAAASFWWWETLDAQEAYRHYRPLAMFLRDLPFTSARLNAVTLTTAQGNRVLAWQGENRVYGWVFNPLATWWNRVVEKKTVPETNGDRLTLAGLKPGVYRLQWWDTRAGTVEKETGVTLSSPTQPLSLPAYLADLAFKLVAAEGTSPAK